MAKRIALILAVLCMLLTACQGRSVVSAPTLVPMTPEPTATPVITPAVTPGVTSGGIDPDTLTGDADAGDVLPELRSYEEYKQVNPDTIGWLIVPNTVIDYPVVRTGDNEYYLTHNVEKIESKHGAVFMDFRNSDKTQQKHIILYGHNMKNGTMFHDLRNYKQKDFFNANPTIKFIWDGKETVWQIYLAYLVKPEKVYHIHTRFGSDQNFADVMNAYVEYAKTETVSNYDPNVTIKATDQVLTLSTCTYEYDGSFFAVSARRIK